MKNLFTISLTVFFTIFSFSAFATTYYLSSSSGNDNNSGTDPSSPWRTIDKLNSYNLQAGDNVLFKRGDTFYGGININSNNSGSPVNFGAYGSGEKPVISGFTSVTSWTNLGGNIWESTNSVSSLSSLRMVVINGVNTPMGRYPNASSSYPFLPNFFHFQSHSGSGSGYTSLTSTSLSGGANWTGAEVVVRTNSWTYDKQTITSQSGTSISYSGQSSGIADGWGFFIQNDIKTLDTQNEWYYNPSTKKISIYSVGTPNNVQISTVEKLFSSTGSISIDNLRLVGANTNAIWLSGNLVSSITNSDISYVGVEGLLLYGGRIQSATITNNTFSNCGSSSIYSTGDVHGTTIKSNKVVGSGMISTYKPNDYTSGGIVISTPNCLVQYNTIDSSAYCGIQLFGDYIEIRNNLVNHSNMVRDDGAGIYTGHNNYAGRIIDGNIVLNSVGNTNGSAPDHEFSGYGIFVDDFGSNITITNNTVANCAAAGINLHDTKNVTVKFNTVYNSGKPGWGNGNLFVQADAGQFTSYVRDNTVTDNIFFAKDANQHSFRYYADPNGDNNINTFGTLDNNYYAKPIDASTSITSQQNIANGEMTLSKWQSISGKDGSSRESPKSVSDTRDIRFEYNASTQSKTIGLDANYLDVKGNSYNGSITLAPYSSAVLIRTGESTVNLLPAVNPSNTVNGIDYKYYEAGTYNSVPDFSNVSPVKTGNVDNFDISVASRADQFALNYTGYINVPSDGQYTFYTSSDDGSTLYIDGVKVVDNDGPHGQVEASGVIGLKAGMHNISVGFFNQTGGKVLQVSYAGPGVSKQKIPSSALYRISTNNLSADKLLPAVSTSNTINGIDYKYYEASNYNSVPDFSNASPVKTGNVDNFDISVANKSEQFAINYTGYINVPSDGQYTFYTSSDDGSTLYIDGVKVVDNDGPHGQQEVSGVIGLKAGMHNISVGFFNQTGNKILQVSYAGPGISKQRIPSSELYTAENLLPAVNPSNTVNGIDYKYYEASNYNSVPDFSTVSPVKIGNVDNFDISVADRAEQFAINYTGYVNVPSDGQYTFYTSSDDGSNLYIDGVKVVDNDGPHGQVEASGVIGLKAGMHNISVGFFNQTGFKILQVSYAGPGVSKQRIPSSALYRVPGDNLLPAVNPSNTVNGIDYKYYEAGTYNSVPDFSKVSPVKTGNVDNFDISVANRAEQFAINYTGYINVPSDGQYTFYTSSDDGSTLYIDGLRVVDNDGPHGQVEVSGIIGLKAGMHNISVGFFNQTGFKILQVSYAGPGVSKQRIPSSALYRVSAQYRIGNLANEKTEKTVKDTGLNKENVAIGYEASDLKVGVKAYPNPFTNSILVSISGEAGKYDLVLVDAMGRTIWKGSGNKSAGIYQQSINTSSLQKGIYFLRVIQNNNQSVIKLEK